MNRTFRSILPLVIMAAACDTAESPLDVGTATNTAEAFASPGEGIQRNDRGVIALVRTIEEAWAAKDAALYASVYAETFDGISPVGGLTTSRAQVQALHAFLFAGIMANSSQTVDIRRIQFLTGTFAIVDLTVFLTGYAAVPPGLTPINAALVSRVRWVVAKRGPRWEIIASQITPLPF